MGLIEYNDNDVDDSHEGKGQLRAVPTRCTRVGAFFGAPNSVHFFPFFQIFIFSIIFSNTVFGAVF